MDGHRPCPTPSKPTNGTRQANQRTTIRRQHMSGKLSCVQQLTAPVTLSPFHHTTPHHPQTPTPSHVLTLHTLKRTLPSFPYSLANRAGLKGAASTPNRTSRSRCAAIRGAASCGSRTCVHQHIHPTPHTHTHPTPHTHTHTHTHTCTHTRSRQQACLDKHPLRAASIHGCAIRWLLAAGCCVHHFLAPHTHAQTRTSFALQKRSATA